ncbi:MAG: hypothetical protein ACJ8BW_11835 [Ktedonobacteraceae bacterium]
MSMTPSHRAFLHEVVSRVPTSYQRLLIHEPSLTAAETQMLLPAGCIVQKTITLQLGPLLLQVSGIGDFSLERRSIRAMASALGLSRRQASHQTINPAHCDPEKEYGLQAGMVSPFLPPKYPTRLAAVVQLPWPVEWEREQREVAVSISLCECLMFPLSSFLDVLREYAKRAYPDHVSFLVLPEGCGSGSYARRPFLDYSHGEIEGDKRYA